MTKRNKVPHCPYCGSANVVRDAAAEWSDEENQWVLRVVYDEGSCDDCGEGGIDEFDWKEQQEEA